MPGSIPVTTTYVNPASSSLPKEFDTFTFPEAPEAGFAVMDVGETTVKDAAGTSPNDTAEASVNCIPVIVTLSCLLAEVGVKDVMMGPLKKVNPGRADTK